MEEEEEVIEGEVEREEEGEEVDSQRLLIFNLQSLDKLGLQFTLTKRQPPTEGDLHQLVRRQPVAHQ